MRKPYLLAALAAAVLVAATLICMTPGESDAAAQSPVRPPARTQTQPAPQAIALIDVSFIFKEHVRLKALMDEMKKDVDGAEAWVKTERDAQLKLMDQLKQFQQGSQEFKSLEQTITKRRAELTVRIQQQKREFLQREARIYYNVYQEIQQEVNYYCQARNVAVVLRFSREAPNVDRPDSVLAFINKPVITYSKDLDITDLVLGQLNRRPAGGNANPIGARQRPSVPFKR